MRVRTQHIPAGPELSLGGNLVTWVNPGAQANDVKGHYNISWLLRKTKQKCQNDPTPQVAAYLLCSVADNLPINTAITLDPKAGGQFISQLHPSHTPLFPSVLQRGEFATSHFPAKLTGPSQLHPQSPWLPVGPKDDMPCPLLWTGHNGCDGAMLLHQCQKT